MSSERGVGRHGTKTPESAGLSKSMRQRRTKDRTAVEWAEWWDSSRTLKIWLHYILIIVIDEDGRRSHASLSVGWE